MVGQEVVISGWLKSKRDQKSTLFLDIIDSTGVAQLVLDKKCDFSQVAQSLPLESAVEVVGKITESSQGKNEILVSQFKVVSASSLELSPKPRSDFDIFDEAMWAHISANRALYLRNPKIISIMQIRAEVMRIVREWFHGNRFVEFDAPILTLAPLYDDSTAMGIDIKGQSAFLTQCAGFYLEAAAHALEKVYNMGPSFRGEESRSKRHLKEYWHIKAEMAWGNRQEIMEIVEKLIFYIYERLPIECERQLMGLGVNIDPVDFQIPFARITYPDAVKRLQKLGSGTKFGEAVSTHDEELLSTLFDGPFWIVGNSRKVEPFPYTIDPDDDRLTMTADLIANKGYGELCGTADKIWRLDMLEERLLEKGKLNDERYKFVVDIHKADCVPHSAFGMGLERLLRWILSIPHVRDTIPMPRLAGRRIDH
jgi:asparaginyl-tRNA synthetase